MQTKLTLRLDDTLIEAAKAHADRRGTSLSRLVADFFRALESKEDPPESLPPITRRLVGSLRGKPAVRDAKKEYRAYLERKYR